MASPLLPPLLLFDPKADDVLSVGPPNVAGGRLEEDPKAEVLGVLEPKTEVPLFNPPNPVEEAELPKALPVFEDPKTDAGFALPPPNPEL